MEMEDIKKQCEEWNPEAKERAEAMKLALVVEMDGRDVSVEVVRYKKLDENIGKEKILPRNYLSFEGVEVTYAGIQKRYYFGQFNDTDTMITSIKKDIYGGRAAFSEEE